MLKEARKPKYLIEGFNLRNLHQYPRPVDPDNLLYEQQVFCMYLAAVSPTFDDLRHQIFYLDEKAEIAETQFSDYFDTKPAILNIQAQSKGIGVDALKQDLLKKAQDQALTELDEKYGFKIRAENEDPRLALKDKYDRLRQRLDGGKMDTIPGISPEQLAKLKAAAQLFDMGTTTEKK